MENTGSNKLKRKSTSVQTKKSKMQTPSKAADKIHNLTVPEIKVQLRTRGLPLSGNKPELIKRLMLALGLDDTGRPSAKLGSLAELPQLVLTQVITFLNNSSRIVLAVNCAPQLHSYLTPVMQRFNDDYLQYKKKRWANNFVIISLIPSVASLRAIHPAAKSVVQVHSTSQMTMFSG